MILKIECLFCQHSVEFPDELIGQWHECPGCGKKIELLLPPKKTEKPPEAKKPPEPKPESTTPPPPAGNKLEVQSSIATRFVFLIGLGLILSGCFAEAQNGINQVYNAVQYTGGWLMIGLALVVDTLIKINKNQK